MNKHDRIKQVKNIARNDHEAIVMLLSSCADMGSERGALLSVAKFDDAAKIILEYLSDRHLTNAMHSDGERLCRCYGFYKGQNSYKFCPDCGRNLRRR